MNLPKSGDYIDTHTHGGKPAADVFIIECLMAHEEKLPVDVSGVAFTFGILYVISLQRPENVICWYSRCNYH